LLLSCLTYWGCTPSIIDEGNEPPQNSFLARSPWPMSHRNPYCQASSPYPGPKKEVPVKIEILDGDPGIITSVISGEYPDGNRVIWANNIKSVFKIYADGQKFRYIARLNKEKELTISPKIANQLSNLEKAKSGAYALIDSDNVFYMPYFTRIYALSDAKQNDPYSAIAVKGEFEIPASALHGNNDFIVGINLTYDGMIAFATSNGTIGVVSRSFEDPVLLYLGQEKISNSIAVCENNGIYIVTDKSIYRVQWTGIKLTQDTTQGAWRVAVETGGDATGIRLGSGSGSTPTLMGKNNQDQFVVITDGQELMHLVFFWRNKIPDDWVLLKDCKDRRIAARIPVTFGDAKAEKSLSEQSVCVRGYGALVVNNLLKKDLGNPGQNLLISGDPAVAPYGAEKFEWDPADRVLVKCWVNREVSLPNGIPSLSISSRKIYGIGQRNGVWTIEAIDWDTGASYFTWPLGSGRRYNSAYSAAEIGYNKALLCGILGGFLRLSSVSE